MINAVPAKNRIPKAVLLVIAFGSLIATLVAAVLNPELWAAMSGTFPLLGRYATVLMLPPLLAWAGFRTFGSRVSATSLLVLGASAAFALYAGLAQTSALVLLLAASTVVGHLLIRAIEQPTAGLLVSATLGGLGVIIGLLGWLLPMHIHSPAASLVLLGLVVFAGRKRLLESLHAVASSWRQVTDAHPMISFGAVSVVGFAAVFTWLPSLNPDDNAAHLLLGNQLFVDGYFHLDASTQIFSVSPWFNDVVQALLQLLSGAEARSGTGLLWLLFGATGSFRLARALRGDNTTSLLAMAVYASHPLTAFYGTTLQVDGASAACLLHLATLCIGVQRNEDEATPILIGVLCGILAAMKITNLVYLGFIGSWLIWRYVSRGQAPRILQLIATAALVAGSSYFYATVVTGNPLFPLYNGIFKSPYMPPVNFADGRWHNGFGPQVLWDLTFATGKYMEAYTGAAGLALLGLIGASLSALVSGGWRAGLTLVALLAGAVVFYQVQYLRYIFPAMALAGTVAVVAFFSLGERQLGLGLMAVLIVAQLGLVKTSSWILNAGVVEQMLSEGPISVRRIEERFVPERAMIRQLAARKDRFCLLLAEPVTAYVALAPGRSLTTALYDSRMNALAQWANPDASGARWQQILNSIGVTDVELRPAQATPALLTALAAEKFATGYTGEAQIWSRNGQSPEQCLGGLMRSRDEARRMFH